MEAKGEGKYDDDDAKGGGVKGGGGDAKGGGDDAKGGDAADDDLLRAVFDF